MPTGTQSAAAMPLDRDDFAALSAVIEAYDDQQLIWTSGYLAGLAQRGTAVAAEPAAQPAAESSPGETLSVFYATETGNSRKLAESLAAAATARGLAAEAVDIARFKPRKLARIERALFVIATHGIGEPPEGTGSFFETWLAADAPALAHLHYGVLALGDSSYADFCETGRALDEALARLGATRLLPRVDCDVDYADAAGAWSRDAVERAADSVDVAAPAAQVSSAAVLHAVPREPAVTRERPFTASVLVNQRITGRGSSKVVRHVELDVENANMPYLPGDSIGIRPTSPPRIVEAVLEAAGLSGDAAVTLDGEELTLADALAHRLEITALSRPLLDAIARGDERLAGLLADRDRLRELFDTRQVGDVLLDFPADWTPQSLADTLRRLPPRLYSIASSADANPGEVHLTVGVVDYTRFGRRHWGSASGFIADAPQAADIFVEENPQFRLPADGNAPIIMIGAGTGVAPYRAFVEQRREHGQRGRNWLLFGDRTFANDFLYQQEWLEHRRDGYLEHLDVAFSRDQAVKRYVQHLLAERGRRFLDWLDRGAHVYVCGDSGGMAQGVQAAILGIFRNDGGLSADAATERLAELRAADRYQRDIY